MVNEKGREADCKLDPPRKTVLNYASASGGVDLPVIHQHMALAINSFIQMAAFGSRGEIHIAMTAAIMTALMAASGFGSEVEPPVSFSGRG